MILNAIAEKLKRQSKRLPKKELSDFSQL